MLLKKKKYLIFEVMGCRVPGVSKKSMSITGKKREYDAPQLPAAKQKPGSATKPR